MHLQYLSDYNGNPTAVLIPIKEWNEILDKHSDLKKLASASEVQQELTMSAFKGILSKERGDILLKHVEQSRNEWDRNA